MSQRNTRPNYSTRGGRSAGGAASEGGRGGRSAGGATSEGGRGGYHKNFGNQNRNQGFGRVLHHTRPSRPPKYNFSTIKSHIINEANDVDLERNTATSATNRGSDDRNVGIQSRLDGGQRFTRKPPRRVTISDNVRHMVNESRPRLAIGETQAQIPLPAAKPYCQLSTLPTEGFQVITEFVQNYIKCYDTNRDDLLSVYHQKAFFSMSINVTKVAIHNPYRFGDLIRESRNLRHVPNTDTEKRFNLLHVGHIDTVNALRKLQPTEHIMESLKMDVSFYNPSISPVLIFSIHGLFKEGPKDSKFRAYRSFQRVFVCISINGSNLRFKINKNSSRIGIVNDQYSISNMSATQFKNYVKEEKRVEPTTRTPTPTPIAGEPTTSIEDQRKAQTQKFSQEARLTPEWANSILEYVGWDYAKAVEAFSREKANLPADAFI